jgi:glycerol-3-phosphate acyltransferase PlsY
MNFVKIQTMFRKLYHLGGLAFPVIMFIFTRQIAVYTSGVLFLLVLLFDMFRLQWKEFNLLIIKKLPIRFKKKEIKNFSGSPFFLGGVFLTLLFFKPQYAFGGIIYLSIGDLSAVTIGKNFGRIKIFNKTLEGTLAFFVATIIFMLLLKSFGLLDLNVLSIVIGAFVCAIVELLPINVDDNFTIPLVGAFVLKLLG